MLLSSNSLLCAFFAFRLECTICHYSVLYDCGCHSNCCVGDGVLLQQVSIAARVFHCMSIITAISNSSIDGSALQGVVFREEEGYRGQRLR